MSDALDADVRRVDEDRWLASRFAPAPQRAALTAIYAFNHEIARTAEVVTQPALGDIRLTWWREAIAEIYAGGPVRAHPVVSALAGVIAARPLPRETFDALIEARRADLEAEPFTNGTGVENYLDATAGGVMRLALAACGDASELTSFIGEAGRAWGLIGLTRAREHLAVQNRMLLPRDVSTEEALARASQALEAARAAKRSLPAWAFPAVGYFALAPAYLKALRSERKDLALIARQLTLVRSAATGRY